ncbi:MAG TPA: protease inhibitor I42 family protein [Gaiellaceae bacterium]
MKLSRSSIAFSVALLVALSLSAAALACNGALVSAGSADNGQGVALRHGQWLVISLKGNATTGYAWKVRSAGRASVLKPLATKYVPNPNPTKLVGKGGVYKIRFEALAPGTTSLKLVYARGSELGGSYTLRVVVR